MLIESRPSLDPELAALVAAQQHEVRAPGGVPASDDDAAYLVAAIGGRVVGCAGWRPLAEAGVAELCRMYVRPAFRGRGVARQLIVAIEEEALAAGRPVIRVVTDLPAAIALCQSSGYAATGVCFEKRLGALVQ